MDRANLPKFFDLMKRLHLKFPNPCMNYVGGDHKGSLDYISECMMGGLTSPIFFTFSSQSFEELVGDGKVGIESTMYGTALRSRVNLFGKKIVLYYIDNVLSVINFSSVYLEWKDDELIYTSQYTDVNWFINQFHGIGNDRDFKKAQIIKAAKDRDEKAFYEKGERRVHISMSLSIIGLDSGPVKSRRIDDILKEFYHASHPDEKVVQLEFRERKHSYELFIHRGLDFTFEFRLHNEMSLVLSEVSPPHPIVKEIAKEARIKRPCRLTFSLFHL